MTTQTDRELLELAAKASGFKLEQGYGQPPEKCLFYMDSEGCYHDWNPLTDDGDALRLMVKLGFLVDGIPCSQLVIVWDDQERKTFVRWGDATGAEADDAYGATRRAIVRAAAEIGKEMK